MRSRYIFLSLVLVLWTGLAWAEPSKIGIVVGADEYIATHNATEGGSEVHFERTAPGTGVMTLTTNSSLMDINATGFFPALTSDPIDCEGKARIAFSVAFDRGDATGSFRVAFYDSADTFIGWSESVTVSVTPSDDFVLYSGDMVAVTEWADATAYVAGDKVVPTDANDVGDWYNCTTGGTSGGSEPTWLTGVGTNVADNTVVWTSLGQVYFMAEVPDPIANELGASGFRIFVGTVPTASAEMSIYYGLL